MVLWVARYIVWATPDATLDAKGLGGMMGTELVVSFVVGVAITYWVRKNKRSYSSSFLYWLSLVLSVSLFIIPALVGVSAIIGILFFSVHI